MSRCHDPVSPIPPLRGNPSDGVGFPSSPSAPTYVRSHGAAWRMVHGALQVDQAVSVKVDLLGLEPASGWLPRVGPSTIAFHVGGVAGRKTITPNAGED
jgi:hypothetical protein